MLETTLASVSNLYQKVMSSDIKTAQAKANVQIEIQKRSQIASLNEVAKIS